MARKWYKVKVEKVQPHLSYGFSRNSHCYAAASNDAGMVIVYNGGLADRRLTREQARDCLSYVSRTPLTGRYAERIERQFCFNLTR